MPEPEDELLPNSSADEFFGRIKHDFRRPKPSAESVASALQAIQKLAGEAAVQQVAEHTSKPSSDPSEKCSHCGATNTGMNRFCGYCGGAMARPEKNKTAANSTSSGAQHVYHHHYHHHYFSDSEKPQAVGGDQLVSEDVLSSHEDDAADDPEPAIQRLVRDWSVRFNAKRLDDLLDLYSSDAIVLRPNAPAAHGEVAIRKLLQSAIDSGLGDVELDCSNLGILGGFACLSGANKMLVPAEPAKRHEERGKFLIVARRDAIGWKIVADSWCMNSPKAQPATPSAVLPIRARK